MANTRRIGHGVRAVEDPELAAFLRETQIPLEVYPSSNLCLKMYPSLEQHSLPELVRLGLYVTINSDDPPMFNTSLTNEFLIVHQAYGWGSDFLQQLVLNAVRVTLWPEEEKGKMFDLFSADYERLRNN